MDLLARSLLTYLLHSTLLLGLAAVGRFALRERRLALQEAILRAALVGAFVTAGLQLGFELKPIGGALTLPAPGTEAQGATPAVRPAPVLLAEEPWQTRAALAPPSLDRVLPAIAGRRFVSWRSALAVLWGGLAVLALVRLVVGALSLRRLLRDREPIRDGHLAPQAATVAVALGLRATLRLSAAPHLGVPLAAGVLRPEVCLPTRVVAELGLDEQVALCAHELAHVLRRDPAWILLARLAEALAPLQPLNAWARRRLQELSECLSDDLAVAACARPVGLARSLVDVASWTLAERPVLPAAAAGAFSARSRLGHRVERLMDPFRSLERPRRAFLPLSFVVVLATAFLTPVVSGTVSGAIAAEPRAEAAGQAPTVPTAEAAPGAQPAPRAEPAPRGASAAKAEAASRAEAASDTAAARHDLERQIEALSERIAGRARLHEREMKQLEAAMQAFAAHFQPNEAELQRVGKEMEAAAQELAAAALENASEGRGAAHGNRATEAAQRLAELQQQLQSKNQALGAEQARALSEQARAMSELARPSNDELRELQRLSHELARASAPEAREISRQTREAMAQVRRAIQQAAEAMRRAAEEARERHE